MKYIKTYKSYLREAKQQIASAYDSMSSYTLLSRKTGQYLYHSTSSEPHRIWGGGEPPAAHPVYAPPPRIVSHLWCRVPAFLAVLPLWIHKRNPKCDQIYPKCDQIYP